MPLQKTGPLHGAVSSHWVRLVTEWYTKAHWLNEDASSQKMLETHGNANIGRPVASVSNYRGMEKR